MYYHVSFSCFYALRSARLYSTEYTASVAQDGCFIVHRADWLGRFMIRGASSYTNVAVAALACTVQSCVRAIGLYQ